MCSDFVKLSVQCRISKFVSMHDPSWIYGYVIYDILPDSYRILRILNLTVFSNFPENSFPTKESLAINYKIVKLTFREISSYFSVKKFKYPQYLISIRCVQLMRLEHCTLHKKWSFLLRIYSVNVSKPSQIWSHLLKKP